MPEVDIVWDDAYREAKSITDVPWETGKPQEELSNLIRNGKLKPCKALDMGCGFGTHAIFLAQKGFDVKAFDISEKAIETAKQRAREVNAKVKFFVGDATKTDFKENFGFIFDRGLFHILDKKDRENYIKTIHKILEPYGKFYLEVFSERNPPGPGPFRFTKKEIEDYFSRYFKILQM